MSKFFYGLYDLANSAYTMIIITFVTSAYFANQIVGNPQLGAAYWQWTAGLCGIVIALTGPFIGSLADKKPKGRAIDVTYVYDTSGKLHCTFTDVTSRKKYEVSLRPESAEDLKKNYEQIEHILIE